MRTGAIKTVDEFGNLTPEGLELFASSNTPIPENLSPENISIILSEKRKRLFKIIGIVIGILLALFLVYWFLIRK